MATAQQISEATDESTSKEVLVRGIRIHYNEIGEGEPIICIHGGGPGATSWSNFRGNLQDLALNNRVILFDMPGWGRSEFPDDAIDKEFIAWIGDILSGFMEALSIGSADIIGNSMGGQAALGLALQSPSKVKHMVMIGSQPSSVTFLQPTPQEALANIGKFYRGEGPTKEKMTILAKSLVYDEALVTDEVVEERFAAATTPEALEQYAKRIKQPRADYYFELEKNSVPTLLVWGQEDKGGSIETGFLMLKRFKNAQMYIFQKCGHWAQVEKRKEFDRVVLNFFES